MTVLYRVPSPSHSYGHRPRQIIAGCTLDMRGTAVQPAGRERLLRRRCVGPTALWPTPWRGAQIYADQQLATGRVDGKLTASFPFTVTLDVLERGHERYDIYLCPLSRAVGGRPRHRHAPMG